MVYAADSHVHCTMLAHGICGRQPCVLFARGICGWQPRMMLASGTSAHGVSRSQPVAYAVGSRVRRRTRRRRV